MALLDVHKAYLGASGVGVLRKRRGALARMRDGEAFAEVQVCREMQRVGREEAALMRVRAQDRDRAEALGQARRSVAGASAQRDALRTAAFGTGSLFAIDEGGVAGRIRVDAPEPAASLEIDEFAGLCGGDARSLESGGGDSVGSGGFVNGGNTCYLNSVLQILLRLPAMVYWLRAHRTHCSVPDMRCIACALWASRLQAGVWKLPELARQRATVGGAFAGEGQQDAAQFLEALLDTLRQGELVANRRVAWPNCQRDVPYATHIDRLFSFVEETRLRCTECKSIRSRFASSAFLKLPLPTAQQRVHAMTVTELYYRWASLETVSDDNAIKCENCMGRKTPHEKQMRICSAPNILAIQVNRVENEQEDVVRHAVIPEEDMSLPGLGQFELAGVVYHSGKRPTSGHYTCACRGTDRMFWRANDRDFTRATLDVERILPKQVYVLVYTRPRGAAVFNGMGVVGSAPARPREVASSGGSAAHVKGRAEETFPSAASTPTSLQRIEGIGLASLHGAGHPLGVVPEARSVAVDLPQVPFASYDQEGECATVIRGDGEGVAKRRRLRKLHVGQTRSEFQSGGAADVASSSQAGLATAFADVAPSCNRDAEPRIGGSFLKRRRGGRHEVE